MRIHHTALYCKDLESMRQFFIDYFCAVSNDQYHNPRTGLRTYILSFPDVPEQLELMQRPDTADTDPSKPNIGFIHLSFSLGSKQAVDDKTIELRNSGYKIVSGPAPQATATMRPPSLAPKVSSWSLPNKPSHTTRASPSLGTPLRPSDWRPANSSRIWKIS